MGLQINNNVKLTADFLILRTLHDSKRPRAMWTPSMLLDGRRRPTRKQRNNFQHKNRLRGVCEDDHDDFTSRPVHLMMRRVHLLTVSPC